MNKVLFVGSTMTLQLIQIHFKQPALNEQFLTFNVLDGTILSSEIVEITTEDHLVKYDKIDLHNLSSQEVKEKISAITPKNLFPFWLWK